MRTYFRTAWTNGCILHACHSGGNQIDLALQNNVEFPENWIEYIYHVGSSRCCHSIFPIRPCCRKPNTTGENKRYSSHPWTPGMNFKRKNFMT